MIKLNRYYKKVIILIKTKQCNHMFLKFTESLNSTKSKKQKSKINYKRFLFEVNF